MMKALGDVHLHQIKSATRDLIDFAGGLSRASEKSGVATSTLSRWQRADQPDLINLATVIALESDCGIPAVTKVMAGIHGRQLSDSGEAGQGALPFMDLFSALHASNADMEKLIVESLTDMKITPNEADMIDRSISERERNTAEMRKALAEIKAGGNFQIVGGSGC